MSVLFLNVQPSVDYSAVKDRPPIERKEPSDKFERLLETKKSKEIEESDESSILYVQDEQGETIKIPLSVEQLDHISNLERVSLVDPEILDQFGGLAKFMEAVRSLIPGNPDISENDIVYLPYQIEALSEETIGSETFPHLIAVNLSPAELNALEYRLDGGQGVIGQVKTIDAGPLVNVLFLAESQYNNLSLYIKEEGLDLSGESLSMLQILSGLSPQNNLVGLNAGEGLARLRGLLSPDTRPEAMALEDSSVDQPNNVFGQTVSSLAQHPSAKPVFAGKDADIQGTLFSLEGGGETVVLGGDIILTPQLSALSVIPLTDSALQTVHAHGVLGAHQAGQAHSATQIIAAVLQKSAGNGGTQKLSVLLNPPDLGRVMIDVEMDAHNKMKVTLTTEKESAYMLLHKETGLLEQTLQNAGLDIESADINLSFSENEFAFDHQNKEDLFEISVNRGDKEGTPQEEDTLHAHMDLYQDPYSGAWHYNSVV